MKLKNTTKEHVNDTINESIIQYKVINEVKRNDDDIVLMKAYLILQLFS